jgi:hypothetical protein
MNLLYRSSRFLLGISLVLFFWTKGSNQAQAVTFKLNDNSSDFQVDYSRFPLFKRDIVQPLYLLDYQLKSENFEAVDRFIEIHLANLETIQPQLLNYLISSIQELKLQRNNNYDNLSQANIPILQQVEISNLYKDVYDFDIDLVERNEATLLKNTTINTVVKQATPNYLTTNWSNNQIILKSVPLIAADNGWTNSYSQLPSLLTTNNYYNYSGSQLRSSDFNSVIHQNLPRVAWSNNNQNSLSVNNTQNSFNAAQQTVFVSPTVQQYQLNSSIQNKFGFQKPESLQRLDEILEKQQEYLKKQQEKILEQIKKEQETRRKKIEKEQEELRKKREKQLDLAQKFQEQRQEKLKQEIENRQKKLGWQN